MIQTRLLLPGEEAAWLRLDGAAAADGRRLRQFQANRTGDLAEDERCFVVAVLDGTVVGRLRGSFFHPTQYLVDGIKVASGQVYATVGRLLLDHAAGILPPSVALEASAYLGPDTAAFADLLRSRRFTPYVDKVYAERDLGTPLPAYDQPFAYRSLATAGRETAVALFGRVNVGSLSKGVERIDAEAEFDTLVACAGPAFDSARWLLAYLGDDPVGLVWPQKYWDAPEQGSIFHIGVVPSHRGRQVGRVLHAKGLAMLKAAGVKRYVGSTEGANLAMRAVFRVNGCHELGVRRFYRKSVDAG